MCLLADYESTSTLETTADYESALSADLQDRSHRFSNPVKHVSEI
jgi:hypothetical protein